MVSKYMKMANLMAIIMDGGDPGTSKPGTTAMASMLDMMEEAGL